MRLPRSHLHLLSPSLPICRSVSLCRSACLSASVSICLAFSGFCRSLALSFSLGIAFFLSTRLFPLPLPLSRVALCILPFFLDAVRAISDTRSTVTSQSVAPFDPLPPSQVL